MVVAGAIQSSCATEENPESRPRPGSSSLKSSGKALRAVKGFELRPTWGYLYEPTTSTTRPNSYFGLVGSVVGSYKITPKSRRFESQQDELSKKRNGCSWSDATAPGQQKRIQKVVLDQVAAL